MLFDRDSKDDRYSRKHYDSDGHRSGYSRPNLSGGYVNYDRKGRRVGYSEENRDGGYDHYNSSGCYIGSSDEDDHGLLRMIQHKREGATVRFLTFCVCFSFSVYKLLPNR